MNCCLKFLCKLLVLLLAKNFLGLEVLDCVSSTKNHASCLQMMSDCVIEVTQSVDFLHSGVVRDMSKSQTVRWCTCVYIYGVFL